MTTPKILLIDLNNEAPFPTLAIGYLSVPLKKLGYDVRVYAPLATGIKPIKRDVEENLINYIATRIRFTIHPLIEWANDSIYSFYSKNRFKPTKTFKKEAGEVIKKENADLILVSAYLQYDQLVKEIAKLAHKEDIKLLLGGPFFNMKEVVEKWITIQGVTAVFGGEPELNLGNIVDDMLHSRDLALHSGIFLNGPNGVSGHQMAPLKDLNKLPVPDFDYYRWPAETNRVIPIMASRGCGWGKCLFCSDVITASTRTFRTRTADSVFTELKAQSEKYRSTNFIFFDSKLNSDLDLWHELISEFQTVVPGATWVATVHVDGKGENGLGLESLKLAYKAGLRRMSFGLETASQSLNNSMLKGTEVNRMSEFVRDASACGISVRTTIMLGYPGETAEDIKKTEAFLLEHYNDIDRVHLSRFKAIPGTGFEDRYERKPERYSGLRSFIWDYKYARAKYRYEPNNKTAYRKQKAKLIKLVHKMNKRPLLDSAQQFNGMM